MIECAAWRRKREKERRERGEDRRGGGVGCLVFKKGEEKERSRQAGERRLRGGGEGRLAGWLAPWLGCVCGERD